MLASAPITIDGQVFDRYSLNLAISGGYTPAGDTDARVAMRLVPTRLESGLVHTADAHATGITLGTLAGADPATQTAVAAIQQALQSYLSAKGL